MIYILLAAIALEAGCVACYLYAGFCRGGKRPLIAKCVCAAVFIGIGVLSVFLKENYSAYAKLMLCGLFFSFWGDFFLGVSMKGKMFIAGLLSFLTAHLFYIGAYIKACNRLLPGSAPATVFEVSALVVVLFVLLLYSLITKIDLQKYKIPVYIYSIVLLAMMVKAVSLSLDLYKRGFEIAALVLTLGAVFFVISDFILMLSLFAGKDTKNMTRLNLWTYFGSQTMLAFSIYFIES